MKPIIIDMKDISYSKEAYHAKPSRLIINIIYILLLLISIVVGLMCSLKCDRVINCEGRVCCDSPRLDISNRRAGAIKEIKVKNGEYVEEDQILFIVSSDNDEAGEIDDEVVKAIGSGYFYYTQQVRKGTYLQEGSTIGKIYSVDNNQYYVELDIKAEDLQNIDIGQEVEIELMPYFKNKVNKIKGKVEEISRNLIDKNNEDIAYKVKVTIEEDNSLKFSEQLFEDDRCIGYIFTESENMINYFIE